MAEDEPFRYYPKAYQGKQFKATLILISSPLLCAAWWHFGRFDFYNAHLKSYFALAGDTDLTAAIYMFSCAFVLLGLVPAAIVKFVFREKLADYGVRLGNWRVAVYSFLVLAPVWLVLTYFSSRHLAASPNPEVARWYPINKSAGDSPVMFGFHAVTFLVFYLGYEFHFRGYLQFGLKETMGDVNAMLVAVMGTVLIHTGKPIPGETFGAWLLGMIWGILVFRSKSLLTSLSQHFLLGLSLDFFLCYT